jgi:hypothetical protein
MVTYTVTPYRAGQAMRKVRGYGCTFHALCNLGDGRALLIASGALGTFRGRIGWAGVLNNVML